METWYKFLMKIKPDGKAFRSILFSTIFYETLANAFQIVKDYAIFNINDQVWFVNDNFDPEPWERRYEITPPEDCVEKLVNGVLTTICYNVSCNTDEECMLEVPLKLSECLPCDPYDCNIYDAGSDEVVAVNKNWTADCPEVRLPEMCIACIGSIEGNYIAKCINNKCLKLTSEYIEEGEVFTKKTEGFLLNQINFCITSITNLHKAFLVILRKNNVK